MSGAPVPHPPPVAPNNLPAHLSSFVGREREVAEVTRLVAGGGPAARLVTVSGTGGAGKTRLALQVAARLLPAFPDGVWLADLAPLADAALVPQVVASAARVPEEPRTSPLATLSRALRTRRVLLVLDNCEHLVDACARLVEAVLGACPHVQVLTTSRELLRVPGETVWRVPPLAVPPPAALPAEALARYESVRLFTERASGVQPRFALTPATAPAVAQICRRLDGMPLAIELAAAQVRVLSVDEILSRLEDRFRLLVGGSRTALPRQGTLRAAVEWSYDLLSEPERRLFARLSVFAGGWTLSAAEAVTGDPDPRPERVPADADADSDSDSPISAETVLTLLTQLADKSLAVVEERGPEPVRYHMLETLRQYAADRLNDSGRAARVHRRHLAYVAALAEHAEAALAGPAPGTWLDRLDDEHDNCRAALGWALDHPTSDAIEDGLRLACGLTLYWLTRGHVREARSWLERLLASPVPAAPTVARAKALGWAAIAATFLVEAGDRDLARARHRMGLDVARDAGDQRSRAWAYLSLGYGPGRQGDAAAAPWLTESLARFQDAGDLNGLGWAHVALGALARADGDYDAACDHYRQSLALFRQTGNRHREAGALHSLGQTLRAAGDAAGSQPLHEEALAIWRELGYPNGVAGALNSLGEVAHARGEFAAARSLYEESLARLRPIGPSGNLAETLKNVSLVEAIAGERAARAHLDEAVAIWRDAGDEGLIAAALEQFATQAVALGQPERALRLAGAAGAFRAAVGHPRPARLKARLEEQLAPARRALGAAPATAASDVGRQLALDDALTEAAGQPPLQVDPATDGASSAEQEFPRYPAGVETAPDRRLRVDSQSHSVWRGAQPLARPLSAQEFTLVRYLYERCERVCTRQEVGDAVWGAGGWDPALVHRLVRRAREKLEPRPDRPRYLLTVPGVGYRLTP